VPDWAIVLAGEREMIKNEKRCFNNCRFFKETVGTIQTGYCLKDEHTINVTAYLYPADIVTLVRFGCASYKSATESYCPNCELFKSVSCPFPGSKITMERCSAFILVPELKQK
jgi:hypothetical protein